MAFLQISSEYALGSSLTLSRCFCSFENKMEAEGAMPALFCSYKVNQ